MTDRIHSLTVTLERDMREDDAQALIDAIRMIKEGIKVQKCPGFTGKHRFEADPNCYGAGLMAEWQQLRSAA